MARIGDDYTLPVFGAVQGSDPTATDAMSSMTGGTSSLVYTASPATQVVSGADQGIGAYLPYLGLAAVGLLLMGGKR